MSEITKSGPCGCSIGYDGNNPVYTMVCVEGKALRAEELSAYDRFVMSGEPQDKAVLDAATKRMAAHWGLRYITRWRFRQRQQRQFTQSEVHLGLNYITRWQFTVI